VLTPALCLSASAAIRWGYDLLHEDEDYLAWFRQMVPSPPLAFWIAIGALAVALAVGYTAWTLELTLGRLGWSHYTTDNTLLPSNTVYDLLGPAGSDDTGMVLATERGAAIWSPPQVTDLPDEWRLFTAENSGLPGDRVLVVARDPGGGLWFGTDAGVGRYDRGAWQTYQPGDMGLMPGQVYALAAGADGRVWVGTESGVAVREAGGEAWTAFTASNSGLGDNWVWALAVEPRPGGDRLWAGTQAGLSRLDTATGVWTTIDEDFGAGVRALFLDAAGGLWAGTQGAGLARWDGIEWMFYRTANSDIPFNTVNAIAEVAAGVLWIGTARPAEVGGGLAEFDGDTWQTLTTRNSGFSGAEPLAFAEDARGRWWIGTRTAGVDVYQPDW
jgi:ligand-binding sensor domain-containing protein